MQFRSVPVQKSSPIDHNDAIDSIKKSIDEPEEAFRCLRCPSMNLKSSRYQFCKQIRQPQLQIIIIHFEAKTTYPSTICNLQSIICNMQFTIFNPKPAIYNPKSTIFNPESSIYNLQSETCNLQYGIY